jgi:hypothetical protein
MSPITENGAFHLPRNSCCYYAAAASRYCYVSSSSMEAEGSSGGLRGAGWSSPEDLEDGCRKSIEHGD